MKVSYSGIPRKDGDRFVSKISLEGVWLEDCGFEGGDLITIHVEPHKLVITPRSKKDLIRINRAAVDLSNVKLNSGDIVYPYFGNRGAMKKEILKATLEGEQYRITSIPYLAAGIALNDLIEVEEEFGCLFFKRIVKKSGNSTIHLQLWDKYWEKPLLTYLESLGCTWISRASGRTSKVGLRIAINVPSTATLKDVMDFLDRGKGISAWEYDMAKQE